MVDNRTYINQIQTGGDEEVFTVVSQTSGSTDHIVLVNLAFMIQPKFSSRDDDDQQDRDSLLATDIIASPILTHPSLDCSRRRSERVS
jgi:hypothetical protein